MVVSLEWVGKDPLELDGNDTSTKRAQPHKRQQSLASFFGAAGAKGGASTAATSRSPSSSSSSVSGGKRAASQHAAAGALGAPAKRKSSLQSFCADKSKSKEKAGQSGAAAKGDDGQIDNIVQRWQVGRRDG